MTDKELIALLRQAADALERRDESIRPINTARKLSDAWKERAYYININTAPPPVTKDQLAADVIAQRLRRVAR